MPHGYGRRVIPRQQITADMMLGAGMLMVGTLASRPTIMMYQVFYYVTTAGQEGWTRWNGTAWESLTNTNLRLENRTSDPVSPLVGQMWLRTDL